jgi:hypothetical protein
LKSLNVDEYGERTGIDTFPTTVLADARGDGACILRGLPTRRQMDECWNHALSGRRGCLFFRSRDVR